MVNVKEIDSLFDEESRKNKKPTILNPVSKHTRRVQMAKLILPSFAAVLVAMLLIFPSLQNNGKDIFLDVTLPKKGELEKLHVEKTVLNITDKKRNNEQVEYKRIGSKRTIRLQRYYSQII